jgi:hypothetical protein
MCSWPAGTIAVHFRSRLQAVLQDVFHGVAANEAELRLNGIKQVFCHVNEDFGYQVRVLG